MQCNHSAIGEISAPLQGLESYGVGPRALLLTFQFHSTECSSSEPSAASTRVSWVLRTENGCRLHSSQASFILMHSWRRQTATCRSPYTDQRPPTPPPARASRTPYQVNTRDHLRRQFMR